ncbi:Dna-directed rna polymerase iii subunit rpc6 [Thalictrum thalictroides]|uniref:DNA-directed RNA polymerase III subunit RPC6 n=1 Tax=Thalictrum thalictroides TaxID=46969 RepID=A0A7J6V8Y8_THATH|nr:Dna-directed rna polymerase iii subunit rpc6 [Thalictrum thalictroides]
MNPGSGNASQKRRRPNTSSPAHNLTESERLVYDEIRKTEDKAIWQNDIKKKTLLPDLQVKKHLLSLQAKNLIKEVVNINYKKRKFFMAAEFEPSAELTGGAWYMDGELDKNFIEVLKGVCKRIVYDQKVVSIESLSNSIKQKGVLNVECPLQQIAQIMQSLVLDNVLMEVTSTGMGEFEAFRAGTKCYRRGKKGGDSAVGAMASIPCGVCPRINECTPDGIISPKTCVYYKKWLDI